MKVRFLLGSFLLMIGCASGSTLAEKRKPSSAADLCSNLTRMDQFAHRGASDRPENMLTAFRRGFEQGADYVEMDLQITKDNRIVVAHDAFVKAECRHHDGTPLGKQMFFRDLTLEQVQELDCGSQVPPGVGPVPGEKVSTLDEVIAALKDIRTRRGRPARLNIEIKYDPSIPLHYPDRATYVTYILNVIRSAHFSLDQFIIQSFDVDTLAEVHRQWPETSLSPLLGAEVDGITIANRIGAKIITPHYGWVTPEMLARYHAAGIRVIPWTVNDSADGLRLIQWGVDGIISDRADWYVLAREMCP